MNTMDRTVLTLLLFLLIFTLTGKCFSYLDELSYMDKHYYKISDGEHSYYTENYQYDSSGNTIQFTDKNGKEIIIYGSASIISPKERKENIA